MIGRSKEAPKLYDDLVYIWQGFVKLSAKRFSNEPIKFTEIESYLNLNCVFDLEQRQDVAHLIDIMDIAYFDFLKEQAERDKNRNRSK